MHVNDLGLGAHKHLCNLGAIIHSWYVTAHSVSSKRLLLTLDIACRAWRLVSFLKVHRQWCTVKLGGVIDGGFDDVQR